jgi:predicted membrane-bound spermidine synthase
MFGGMSRNARDPSLARSSWRYLLVLFFLSGLSGLIYESIWSRYLRLFVGSAATAQVLVLALFMGGMSVGAALAGRFGHRIRAPVAVYGLIEGAIALYALAFHHLHLGAVRLSYDVLFPIAGGGVEAVKWSIAGLLVLPPAVLLGATFPVMSTGILRRDPQRSGEILSLLYFSNSVGAALGALLSGFLLVRYVGLHGALAVAAAINFGIMLVAIRDRRPLPPIERSAEEGARPSGLALVMLTVAFGTGLASFMYEVGWVRLLSMVLGSATRSFEIMLSAFVLGLALGGLWIRRRMDRYQRPELVLAVVQLLMGAAAVATLPLYRLAVLGMGAIVGQGEPSLGLWVAYNVGRYGLCLLIMLPATFCAGMTLPLLTHVLLRRGHSEGVVGRAYAMNTLGAIAGAVLAGIVLMPLVGLHRVVVGGALVDMALGLLLLARLSRVGTLGRRVVAEVGALAVLVAGVGLLALRLDPMVLTSSVYREGKTRLHPAWRVIFYEDGRTATVAVAKDTARTGDYLMICTNGKPDASAALDPWPPHRPRELGPQLAHDASTQVLLGLVPVLVHPDPRRAAVVGLGSGVTSHVLLGAASLELVDTVEIEPEMVEGARLFVPANRRVFEDPRSHIHIDDAKAYFAATGGRYDLIVSEPSNPWVSGVANLFSVEFYSEIRRYLNDGGVFAQWVHAYELGDDLVVTILAALDRAFVDYHVYRIGVGDWLVVASADRPLGTVRPIPEEWKGVRQAGERLGIHDVGQIDSLLVATRELLHPFLAGREPNSDFTPTLDNLAERDRFFRRRSAFLEAIDDVPLPLLRVHGEVERRPYPERGIGDLRERGILHGPETARALLRFHEHREEDPPRWLDASSMRAWQNATSEVTRGEGDWEDWIEATFSVFEKVEPHVAIAGTSFWTEVRETAGSPRANEQVGQAVDLLDAVAHGDGARILDRVERALDEGGGVLPRRFVVLSGLLGLELVAAPAERRQAFVERHMQEPSITTDQPTAEQVADEVLRDLAVGAVSLRAAALLR